MTDAPYPNSYDRVFVAVFCTKTGAIKQVVSCALEDAHRQHSAFADHDYLDVTGTAISPHEHVVDLGSRTVVSRAAINAGDVALKQRELDDAYRDAAPEADHTLVLRAALGDASAKASVLAVADKRDAALAKLNGLLASVQQAKTRDELAAIHW